MCDIRQLGIQLSDAMLFIVITTTLAVYDIKPYVRDGVEEMPDAKWQGEILMCAYSSGAFRDNTS